MGRGKDEVLAVTNIQMRNMYVDVSWRAINSIDETVHKKCKASIPARASEWLPTPVDADIRTRFLP